MLSRKLPPNASPRSLTRPSPLPPAPPAPLQAVAGLEGEVGKLLEAARAVQQQYAINAAGAQAAGEERAVDQQQQGGSAAAAAAEGQAADVAMREAGEV